MFNIQIMLSFYLLARKHIKYINEKITFMKNKCFIEKRSFSLLIWKIVFQLHKHICTYYVKLIKFLY